MSRPLDRRRDQLETDIKSALNFLRGTDLVLRLMQAADSYAAKCCEAALEAERARLRQPIAILNDWLEHLPQRHVPLRAAEALLRLRNLTAPGEPQLTGADITPCDQHESECGEPTVLGGYERPCQMPPGHDGPHLRKPVPLHEMPGHA